MLYQARGVNPATDLYYQINFNTAYMRQDDRIHKNATPGRLKAEAAAPAQ